MCRQGLKISGNVFVDNLRNNQSFSTGCLTFDLNPSGLQNGRPADLLHKPDADDHDQTAIDPRQQQVSRRLETHRLRSNQCISLTHSVDTNLCHPWTVFFKMSHKVFPRQFISG